MCLNSVVAMNADAEMNLVEEKEEQVEAAMSQKIVFGASVSLAIFSFFFGFVSTITQGKLSIAINLLFLFGFGLVCALVDPPWETDNPSIHQLEMVVTRYCNLLTSVTGKGLGLIVAGRMFSNAMYAGQISGVMSFVYCTFITAVGFMTLSMGYLKTRKLSNVRDAIIGSAPPGYVESQVENVIAPFAKSFPVTLGDKAGLAPDEFNNLVTTLGRDEAFNDVDVNLVFKQLRLDRGFSKPKGNAPLRPKLTVADLKAWFDKRAVMVLL